MAVIDINDINDFRVREYTKLTDGGLRHFFEKENGIFIAESPKVIQVALDSGLKPLSLLCETKHITGDAAHIIKSLNPDIPIYTGGREVLSQITGYTLTRGVLCAMRRPTLPSVAELLRNSKRIAVIDGVCDSTNIGSIFRAAAALGVDGIILTRSACDPLNRRSIRVSMGTVFKIRWTWLDDSVSSLRNFNFKIAAMALRPGSVNLDNPTLNAEERLAIVLGTEGDGLSNNVIAEADYSVIIPMHNDVDSLNVASAAAVAFWQLCNRK